MPVLFRRDVPIRTLVAIEPRQARAVQAPIRMAMLDLLAQRPMSVEDLSEELPAHGFRKATNTLRHHLEILVSSGLVELAVLEQTRGAVLKYFAAAARPLHFELSEAAEPELASLAARLEASLATTLESLPRSEQEQIARLAGTIRRCPRCSPEYYEEFVLLTAMHRACVAYLRRHRPGPAVPARGSPTARRARLDRPAG